MGLNRTGLLTKGCGALCACLVAKILPHMDVKYFNIPCDVSLDKVHLSLHAISIISHILFVDFVPVTPVQPASTNDLFWLVSLVLSCSSLEKMTQQ